MNAHSLLHGETTHNALSVRGDDGSCVTTIRKVPSQSPSSTRVANRDGRLDNAGDANGRSKRLRLL